ncbi:MAG: hypothetical protein U5L98_07990 [Halomonas sp.]|nr:hypothetical protein [Halomonas sp.]MDZ7852574.1 hypothetical protein [Halomonas sp.]
MEATTEAIWQARFGVYRLPRDDRLKFADLAFLRVDRGRAR